MCRTCDRHEASALKQLRPSRRLGSPPAGATRRALPGRHLGFPLKKSAGIATLAACWPTKLQLLEEAVVVGMAADPEPCNFVVLQESDGAVGARHTHGVDRFSVVNLFELEAGVPGILAEEPVGLLRGLPNLVRQLAVRCPEARRCPRLNSFSGSSSVVLPAARSARTSPASLLRASCEARNLRAHRSSSRSSSSSQRATRSCSSGGRVANFAIAVFSAWVMG